MSEITKYESYLKKLEGLCEEHDLTFRLRKDEYPVSLTIRPVQGVYEQMTMLEKDGDVLSPDAYLRFEIRDGEVSHRTGGTFVISDALFTKLRALFRNLEYRWLQYFFRDVAENRLVDMDSLTLNTEDGDGPEEDGEPDWESKIRLATAVVRAENKASTDLLAERLSVSEDEAGMLLDELEDRGVIDEDGAVLPMDAPEEAEADEET